MTHLSFMQEFLTIQKTIKVKQLFKKILYYIKFHANTINGRHLQNVDTKIEHYSHVIIKQPPLT